MITAVGVIVANAAETQVDEEVEREPICRAFVVVFGFQVVLVCRGNAIIEHQLKMEAKETE